MRICSKRAWFHQPSANRRWKVSLPQQEQPGLKISLRWESPPALKRCPGKMGGMAFAESLSLYTDCKRSASNVVDCLLSFISLKSVSGWTIQGKWLIPFADKQRTPLCYWSGLPHPAIFRVKKPDSTNRICVCSYLVCLDFQWQQISWQDILRKVKNSLPSGVSLLVQGF